MSETRECITSARLLAELPTIVRLQQAVLRLARAVEILDAKLAEKK